MQQTREIGLMMFAYSNDHNGKYPDGKSSTEVFQKLLDGNYASDPFLFYVTLSGKTKALEGQKLKPENVCFDVTSGVDANASDDLPLVYSTGYKVNYTPAGVAILLLKQPPTYGWENPYPSWYEWWTGRLTSYASGFITVAYKSNSAKCIWIDATAKPNACIPNFVPTTFDAKGKTYHQLTPEGELP